jgi:hypothetical protein
MIYALLECKWLSEFWRGLSTKADPLWSLLSPIDQRGEVYAWGPIQYQHWTLTDALEYDGVSKLIALVSDIVADQTPPKILPKSLDIHRDTQLVSVWDSLELDQLKLILQDVTGSLICKTEISDEEFQRARWWVEHMSNEEDLKTNLVIFEEAHSLYQSAGEPPLPTSRHFRLNMLVGLLRNLTSKGSDETHSRLMLNNFLQKGVPPWYGEKSTLHMTIASGLLPNSNIEIYQKNIWPKILDMYSDGIQLNDLAIMVEEKEKPVKVKFFDSLTQRFISETRSNFKIKQRVYFKQQTWSSKRS